MVQYYLRHYFNPDFDYLNLKPGGDNGASDVYSLGYVQNVIAGQVLAELVPLDNAEAGYDRRFVLDKPVFPMPTPFTGPTCIFLTFHPGQILPLSAIRVLPLPVPGASGWCWGRARRPNVPMRGFGPDWPRVWPVLT